MLKYCPDRYKTPKVCREAVDDCVSALKFVPNWFATDKMIKKLHEALFANNISFLMKILVKTNFLVVKWQFLV